VFASGPALAGDSPDRPGQVLYKLGLTFVLALGLWAGADVQARAPRASADSEIIALRELPVEARKTYELIHAGGPFPYAKDGSQFGNRERLLPPKARGHYREYTVRTPGARDRGARRIVCGGAKPAAPEACYYTADHYASFRRIAQ
jgi:ribonuclease T1